MGWSPLQSMEWVWPHAPEVPWGSSVQRWWSPLEETVRTSVCISCVVVWTFLSTAAPIAMVMNISVVAGCPSNLLVSWLPLTPEQLRAPAENSSYVVSYGGVEPEVVPYSQTSDRLLVVVSRAGSRAMTAYIAHTQHMHERVVLK